MILVYVSQYIHADVDIQNVNEYARLQANEPTGLASCTGISSVETQVVCPCVFNLLSLPRGGK